MLLDVGDGHRLFVETYGNTDGIPALFLHGGPGSGCQASHRALFDAAAFRVVMFDQRGAGRSLPHGAREANTTAHCVADIERIRAHFGIDRWLVVGGSWGATLALAYAQAHPAAVRGMVLRSVFLGTRGELDRAFGPMLAQFYPDLHAAFVNFLPMAERGDPLPAYWRRILSPDPAIHLPAALQWYDTERALSQLIAPPPGQNAHPATPFMEAHYFQNDCFLTPDQLLSNAHRIAGIPMVMVQARYDLLCPPATTYALAQRLPLARIAYAEAAGHGQNHSTVDVALRQAIAGFAA